MHKKMDLFVKSSKLIINFPTILVLHYTSQAEIAAASAELKKLEDDQERWKEKEEELARKERVNKSEICKQT